MAAGAASQRSRHPTTGPPASIDRRKYLYGLRSDGVLFRWAARGASYDRPASYPGFASVKAMTLISQTATYDTFLANTRGGALHDPHPGDPTLDDRRSRRSVARLAGLRVAVRRELRQAEHCAHRRRQGHRLRYLYAVSHATGATTVILSPGKIPAAGAFPDPVYYLRHPKLQNLNGE